MASSISELCGLLAAVLVELAVVTTALAQPAARETVSEPPGNPAVRAAARAKLVEGVAALKRGDHRAALARFEEGYALVPSPKIFYNFGLAYLGLGRPEEALSAFERFLAEAPDAAADKRDLAARQVAALRPRVGALIIKEAPAGAASAVDAPREPMVAAPPAPNLRQTPAPAEPLSLVHPAAGEDPMRARRVAAIASGAAGLTLLAAGVTFGLLARRESDSLTRDSENGTAMPTPFDPSKESRGTTYETLQAIGLGAGALGLAVGVVLYSTTRGRVTAEPLAARSVVGANLKVGF